MMFKASDKEIDPSYGRFRKLTPRAVSYTHLDVYKRQTLSELKATFKRDFLGNFAQYEFIQENIENAKRWKGQKPDHEAMSVR